MNRIQSPKPIPAVRATMATRDSDSGDSQHSSPATAQKLTMSIPPSGYLELPYSQDCILTCSCPSEPTPLSPRFTSNLIATLNSGSASAPPRGKACLAMHVVGDYVAFVGQQGGGEMGDQRQRGATHRNEALVHVVNIKTNQELHLVGMRGAVQDLAFARIFDRVVLGQVDELGNVLVVEIIEASDKFKTLKQSKMLELVNESLITRPSEHHRLAWCPFIPQDEEDEKDGAFTLAVVHNSLVEMFNVTCLSKVYVEKTLNVNQVFEGRAQIGLGCLITHVDLSPDASIVLVALEDGRVNFYQYDLDTRDAPELVQSWTPLEGTLENLSPVSSLWFLDDRSQNCLPADSPLFWKFNLVGAVGNSILKLFACEDWERLQTITFLPKTTFSSCIDPRGNFLILAHMESPMLLILRFESCKSSEGDELSRIFSVQQVHLPFIIRTFAIRNNAENIESNVIEMLAMDQNGLYYCKIYPHAENATVSGFTSVGEQRQLSGASEERTKTEKIIDCVEEKNTFDKMPDKTSTFTPRKILPLSFPAVQQAPSQGENTANLHQRDEDAKVEIEVFISDQLKKFRQSFLDELKESLNNFLSDIIKREVNKILGKYAGIEEKVTKDVEDLFQRKLFPEMNNNIKDLFEKTLVELKQGEKVQDRKQTIEVLIGQGKFNRALQMALEADDLNLIMTTCKSINLPNILGKEPSVLETETILSALDKLGRDFHKNSELKSKYMQDIILHVDDTEPVVKKKFEAIKRELYGNIEKALEDRQNMEPKNVKALRVLRMICQSQNVSC